MRVRRTVTVAALLLGVTAAVFAAGRRAPELRPGEYEVDGRIFGMPAAEVFTDDYSSTVDDPDHSAEEERSLIFGATKNGKALVVSFTDRGDRIRIIGARSMTQRERRAYEQ